MQTNTAQTQEKREQSCQPERTQRMVISVIEVSKGSQGTGMTYKTGLGPHKNTALAPGGH